MDFAIVFFSFLYFINLPTRLFYLTNMLRAAFTGTVSRIAVRSALPATRPMAMGNLLTF